MPASEVVDTGTTLGRITPLREEVITASFGVQHFEEVLVDPLQCMGLFGEYNLLSVVSLT